jgi:hypothetical protein
MTGFSQPLIRVMIFRGIAGRLGRNVEDVHRLIFLGEPLVGLIPLKDQGAMASNDDPPEGTQAYNQAQVHRAAAEPPLSGECAGAQIGAYKLLEKLGEGGMGTV